VILSGLGGRGGDRVDVFILSLRRRIEDVDWHSLMRRGEVREVSVYLDLEYVI
jgi:hypothetical protein